MRLDPLYQASPVPSEIRSISRTKMNPTKKGSGNFFLTKVINPKSIFLITLVRKKFNPFTPSQLWRHVV